MKAIRIFTKHQQILDIAFPPNLTLASVVGSWRTDGFVVTDHWWLPFDMVASCMVFDTEAAQKPSFSVVPFPTDGGDKAS